MCNKSPFVSIIVPVYNGQATIVECIESLLAQNYLLNSFEVIVVDNGSTDQTLELIQPYVQSARIKLLSETKVLNAYGARNTGAKAARGEIFVFTDADCIADSKWLINLIQGRTENNVGAFIGEILPYSIKTAIERFYSSEKMSMRERVHSDFPGMRAGNCAVTRECFWKLGGFKTHVNSGGDSDFLKRMLMETDYTYRIALDAIVLHKNCERLWPIFRRHLRFGTNISQIRNDHFLGNNYVPWTANANGILFNLISFIVRLGSLPIVLYSGSYRGREVADTGIFLMEPIIRFIEYTGLLAGRMFRLKAFR